MPTEPMKDEELRKWAAEMLATNNDYSNPDVARAVLSLLDRLADVADSLKGEEAFDGNLATAIESLIAQRDSLLDRQREAEKSERAKGPVHPVECRISISGEDWDYVQRQLSELLDECANRDPVTFQMYGGGGGGSFSVTTTTRDISKADFREELANWFDALPTPPAETETK